MVGEIVISMELLSCLVSYLRTHIP